MKMKYRQWFIKIILCRWMGMKLIKLLIHIWIVNRLNYKIFHFCGKLPIDLASSIRSLVTVLLKTPLCSLAVLSLMALQSWGQIDVFKQRPCPSFLDHALGIRTSQLFCPGTFWTCAGSLLCPASKEQFAKLISTPKERWPNTGSWWGKCRTSQLVSPHACSWGPLQHRMKPSMGSGGRDAGCRMGSGWKGLTLSKLPIFGLEL